MARRRGGRWKPGDQRAPRMPTILVSILLVLVGALLTFGLPTLVDALSLSASIADSLEWVGRGSYVAAMVVMLLGIFLEGL